jgi:hypothetical protein
VKITQVAEFKACLTCVYHKFYPPAMRDGQPVFARFYCSRAVDSNKDIVQPEEVCGLWKGVTLNIEQCGVSQIR